jgi:inositol phosphorylceramide mannosyltransferase catalytic subunit
VAACSRLARGDEATVLIPRIFHQIWVGADPFPAEYAEYQQTWLDRHPGWELRLWTEQHLPDGLRRPEAAERLRAPAERANILRLELLWRYGGVYVDADFRCLRSIESLIENATFFISLAKESRVNNALMGSVPGHPILDEALDRIRPREFFGHDKAATGTRFLDTLLLGRSDVTLIEPERFYPQTAEARRAAYAIHDMARSWKDPDLLRLDVERAERKLERAQERARKWRERYRQAQDELADVRRSWPYRLSRLGQRLTRRSS